MMNTKPCAYFKVEIKDKMLGKEVLKDIEFYYCTKGDKKQILVCPKNCRDKKE